MPDWTSLRAQQPLCNTTCSTSISMATEQKGFSNSPTIRHFRPTHSSVEHVVHFSGHGADTPEYGECQRCHSSESEGLGGENEASSAKLLNLCDRASFGIGRSRSDVVNKHGR